MTRREAPSVDKEEGSRLDADRGDDDQQREGSGGHNGAERHGHTACTRDQMEEC